MTDTGRRAAVAALAATGATAALAATGLAAAAARATEPLPLFRFPYGATSDESVADVNDLGYAVLEFTADTNGYLGPEAA